MADEVKKGYGIFIDGTQYATMEGATTETAGLMTAADKQQLNEMVVFSEETNTKFADVEEEISNTNNDVQDLSDQASDRFDSVEKSVDKVQDSLDSSVSSLESDIATLTDSLSAQNIFSTGTALAAGQDLNDVTDYGKYNSGSSSVSSGLTNAPITGAGFGLFVFPCGSQITQFAIGGGQTSSASSNFLYLRNYSISNGTWTSWYAFSATKM